MVRAADSVWQTLGGVTPLDRAGKPALRFRGSGVFDPPAHFEGAGERALRESEVAVGEVGLAPGLRRVGFAPGVAAVRMGGEVERLPRRLVGFGRIRPGQW